MISVKLKNKIFPWRYTNLKNNFEISFWRHDHTFYWKFLVNSTKLSIGFDTFLKNKYISYLNLSNNSKIMLLKFGNYVTDKNMRFFVEIPRDFFVTINASIIMII